MNLEESVTVGGKKFSLLKVKSFLFGGKRYSLFIDPDDTDDDGSPIPYVLKQTSDDYVLAEEEVIEKIIPYIADILAGNEHFSFFEDFGVSGTDT